MGRVVIGMDPHKRSATIEVIDEAERVLQQGHRWLPAYGCDSRCRDRTRTLYSVGGELMLSELLRGKV